LIMNYTKSDRLVINNIISYAIYIRITIVVNRRGTDGITYR
jgi:hypothetical protein